MNAARSRNGSALITTVAVFAFVAVLAISITSVTLARTDASGRQTARDQAYLTAQSVLLATQGHLRENPAEARQFAGRTASGELNGMGSYTARVEEQPGGALKITVDATFNGQTSQVIGFVEVANP